MYNELGKLVIVKQSKGCRCVPKMHQNTFGWARTRWES